jgi:Kef-type K+ transport system membrane component KefB
MDEVYKQFATIIPLLIVGMTIQSSFYLAPQKKAKGSHLLRPYVYTNIIATILLIVAEGIALYALAVKKFSGFITVVIVTFIFMGLVLLVQDYLAKTLDYDLEKRMSRSMLIVFVTLVALVFVITLWFVSLNKADLGTQYMYPEI